MKNVILYYYNLEVSHIRQVNDKYYLTINGEDYLFETCDPNINKIINYLPSYTHTIINTINNSIYVFYNDDYYFLLKLKGINKKIDIEDIDYVNYPNDFNVKEKWISLWSEHIDYIEFQMDELKNKYPLLASVVNYYIGLTENAIELLKSFNFNVRPYLVHKRLNVDTTYYELYDPNEYVIDSKVRDLAEYFKSMLLKNIDITRYYYLIDRLDDFEKCMFFVRFLYPSYFFDIYDDVMKGLKEDMYFDKRFENDIKRIYLYIKKTTYIQNIDWL